MKKINSNSTTSMSEVMLSSGSSLRPARLPRFMCSPRVMLFERLHYFDGFFFHVDDQIVLPPPQESLGDERRNRHRQPRRRGDQGFGNPARHRSGIAHARRG